MSFVSGSPTNNYKLELYQTLLEHSPFGTLVFVYGVCVECNPSAEKILLCERRVLLGSSLQETHLDEPLALIALKQQLNTALEEGVERFEWHPGLGNNEVSPALDIHVTGNGSSEIIVTLLEGQQVRATPDSNSPEPYSATPSKVIGAATDVTLAEDLAPCNANVELETFRLRTVEQDGGGITTNDHERLAEEKLSVDQIKQHNNRRRPVHRNRR